jgi:hypothetical protein
VTPEVTPEVTIGANAFREGYFLMYGGGVHSIELVRTGEWG